MSDAELIERHLSGDRTAMVRLLELHEGPLLRYARTIVDGDLAQDAVQEAFLRFVREGDRARGIGSVFAWLLQVTRRVALDLSRKERRMDRKHQAAPVAESTEAPDAALAEGEIRDKVRDAVARLPEPQKEILRLKLWEGLSYRDIGARLGMTLTNVSYHLGRAVKAVAGDLRSVGIGEMP